MLPTQRNKVTIRKFSTLSSLMFGLWQDDFTTEYKILIIQVTVSWKITWSSLFNQSTIFFLLVNCKAQHSSFSTILVPWYALPSRSFYFTFSGWAKVNQRRVFVFPVQMQCEYSNILNLLMYKINSHRKLIIKPSLCWKVICSWHPSCPHFN